MAKPHTSHSHDEPAAAVETFLQLSRALTAEKALTADLADAYFKRAQEHLDAKVSALLDRFATLVKSGGNPVDIVPLCPMGTSTTGNIQRSAELPMKNQVTSDAG